MDTIYKTTQYPIKTLIDDIEYGKIALPDIQRPFVWDTTQVRDLFDSLYKGFPTGYLLFWENSERDDVKKIGNSNHFANAQSLIIDGQQRLTALFTTIKAIPIIDKNFKEKRIKIAFNPATETFEVSNPAIEKDINFIDDISILFKSDFSEYSFIRNYIEKLKNHRELSHDEESKIAKNISSLRNILSYQFTILVISANIDEETVSNIFVRVNSKGVVLKQSDFVLTLLSVFWEEGRRDIEKFCIETRNEPKNGEVSVFNHLMPVDPDQILRAVVGFGFLRGRMRDVYSLLRGRNFDTRTFEKELQKQRLEELKQHINKGLDNNTWHDYITLIQSLGFKHGDLITSKTNFFYSYTFYLIGKYQHNLYFKDLEKIVSKWFLFNAITSRYSGSSESVFEGDLNQIKIAKNGEDYINIINDLIDNSLTNDYWEITAPSILDSSSSRNPLGLLFIAAQIKNNVPLLFSNKKISDLFDPVITPKKNRLDKHHIFPKNYLKKELGIEDLKLHNQIANMVYLDYKTNIDISDTNPSDYFSKLSQTSPNSRENDFANHAIPEEIENLGYDEFLKQRRKLIVNYIKEYYQGI